MNQLPLLSDNMKNLDYPLTTLELEPLVVLVIID